MMNGGKFLTYINFNVGYGAKVQIPITASDFVMDKGGEAVEIAAGNHVAAQSGYDETGGEGGDQCSFAYTLDAMSEQVRGENGR